MYWPIQGCAAIGASFESSVDNNAALGASVLEALTASQAGRLGYNILRATLAARERLLHVTGLAA